MVDRRFDDILPWGHWMRVKPGTLRTILVDEDDREWPSLREAFFHGRLGFGSVSSSFREVELERMLAYLLAAGSRPCTLLTQHARLDLLSDKEFGFFYAHWLVGQGLMEDGGSRAAIFESGISKEGHSVAKMLLATRPPELAPFHPGVESILFAGGRAEEIRRPAFERGDQDLGQLKYAFVRERIGRAPAISLLHRNLNARMPLVRTIWTQSFVDESSRDTYFAWMSRRLDRWNVWGDIVTRKSSAALSQHLFSLLACEFADRPDAAQGARSGAARDADTAPPLLAIEHRTT